VDSTVSLKLSLAENRSLRFRLKLHSKTPHTNFYDVLVFFVFLKYIFLRLFGALSFCFGEQIIHGTEIFFIKNQLVILENNLWRHSREGNYLGLITL